MLSPGRRVGNDDVQSPDLAAVSTARWQSSARESSGKICHGNGAEIAQLAGYLVQPILEVVYQEERSRSFRGKPDCGGPAKVAAAARDQSRLAGMTC